MGVHIANLSLLMHFYKRIKGAALMLGRQGFHIGHADQIEAANELVKGFDKGLTLDVLRGDGWCENLFRQLGAETVQSLDNSNYEGAEIVHDMNAPISANLENRFDVIFDGGTLEHIYDFPAAVRNISKMLKPRGLFLSSNGANNFLGHGFYQFSPELMWQAFSNKNGFRIELLELVEETNHPTRVACPNPEITKRREEIRRTERCTLLQLGAWKIRDVDRTVQQSDYVQSWKEVQSV